MLTARERCKRQLKLKPLPKILRAQAHAGSSPALGTTILPDSAAISSADDFGCQVPRAEIATDFG